MFDWCWHFKKLNSFSCRFDWLFIIEGKIVVKMEDIDNIIFI